MRIGKKRRADLVLCLEGYANSFFEPGDLPFSLLDLPWGSQFIRIVRENPEFGRVEVGGWFSAGLALELAALLRDGWNPGDPVEPRMKKGS